MKKFSIMVVVFVWMAFMLSTVNAAPIVIKIGDSTPKSFAYYDPTVTLKQEIEQKTGGKVEVQFFGDGVLGDQKTLMESTIMGSIHMSIIASSVLQSMVPQLKIFTLPFVWPNYKVLTDFIEGPEAAKLDKMWEKHGLLNMGWGYAGEIGVQNRRRAIKTPEDLKGLKIRTMQDPVMVDTINAMGGMGVAMGLGELYTAVQQGTIDGLSTSPQLLNSLKIYEVAKFYAPFNMHYTPVLFIMNMKFYNSLPPDVQNILREACKTWGKNVGAKFLDPKSQISNDYIFKVYKEKGVEVTPLDVAPFRKLTVPVVKKYRDQIGADYVDQILKYVGYKLE
jgi:tripartite ATP-independent transporter DctP family solute receptor